MKKSFKSAICSVILSILITGCLSFNLGDVEPSKDDDEDCDTEVVLLANENNVYRLSTNTILRVKVQGKNGKWTESKHRVLVPEDWYVISKDALD